MDNERQDLTFCLILALLPLVLFVPALVSNQIPYFMDIVTQFFPVRAYAASLLHRAELPLFNPAYYCGVPLLANPQWGILYPGNLLFFLFPVGSIFTLTLLLHQIVGSLGVYLLVRRLTGDSVGALAGGLIFSFSGYVWAHYAFGAFLCAIAWVPFVFWCLERYSADRRRHFILLAGCFVAMQMLAGAPQIALYSIMSYAVVCITRGVVTFLATKSWRAGLTPLVFFGAAVTIGAGLSAPQWLSSVVFLRECERAGGLSLPEIKVGTLTLADLWRVFTGGTAFPEDAETTAYVGVGVIVLLLFVLLRKPKAEIIPYIVLLALTCVYPLRFVASILYQIVPGYSHFHDPKRVLGITAVLVPMLCAYAISRTNKVADREKRTEIARLLAAIVAAVVFELTTSSRAWKQWSPSLPPALGWIPPPQSLVVLQPWLTLGAAVCVAAIATVLCNRLRRFLIPAMIVMIMVDLATFAFLRIDLKCIRAQAIFGRDNSTYQFLLSKDNARYFTRDSSGHYSYDYTRPAFGEWLLPNVGSFYALEDFQGYDPIKTKRYAAYLAVLNEGYGMRFARHFGIVTNPRSPLLQRANVGFEISEDNKGEQQARAVRVLTESFTRLQSVSRFVQARNLEDALLRLRNEVQHQSEMIVVESAADFSSIVTQFSRARILESRFSANHALARVENHTGYSWLVLRNGYTRGWKAYVDGKRAPLYPVDVLFMGVLVPRGIHTVSFTYLPAELLLGALVALLTTIVIAALWFFSPMKLSLGGRTKRGISI